MTIDEAISFCDEKSKNIKLKAEPQTFVDIKEMLKELKELKQEEYDNTQFQLMSYADGYNKAIDDFFNKCLDENIQFYADPIDCMIEVKEQLKR